MHICIYIYNVLLNFHAMPHLFTHRFFLCVFILKITEENYCHVKECERALLNYHKYQLLVDLYFANDMHRSALTLLKKLGSHHNESAPLHGVEPTGVY